MRGSRIFLISEKNDDWLHLKKGGAINQLNVNEKRDSPTGATK